MHDKRIRLSLSGVLIIFLMIAAAAGAASIYEAFAVGGDGTSDNIRLNDSDNDGTPDRVVFEIENPNGETWQLQGASPHGLVVTQDGNDIDISSVSFSTAADADPVIVLVNLDENDGDMVDNTDGVNEEPIELSYAQVTFGTCDAGATPSICDDTDDELNAIASGDTGASDTEIDLMNPVAESVTADRTTISGVDYSSVALEYSETVQVFLDGEGGDQITGGESGTPTNSSGVGGIADANTYTGLFTLSGEGEGGNVTQNDVNGNTIQLSGDAKTVTVVYNTDADNYWTSGTSGINTNDVVTLEDADGFIEDDNGNGANDSSSSGVTLTTAWDISAPTVTNTYSCDSDLDGDIDLIEVVFSEEIIDASFDATDWEGDNEIDGTEDEEPSSFDTATTAGCDIGADADANDEHGEFNFTTGINGTDNAYLNLATGGLRDWSGNRLTLGNALGTEQDRADPVLMSSTPSDGGEATPDQDISFTFSEPMNPVWSGATHYTFTPSPGGFSHSYSNNNRTVTISHAGMDIGAQSVDLVPGVIDADDDENLTMNTGGPQDEELNFTVSNEAKGKSSEEQIDRVFTYEAAVEAPNGGEAYKAGDVIEIKWHTSGTGAVNYVNLSYSPNAGEGWVPIATNIENSGSYSWIAPAINSGDVLVEVASTDLVNILASDVSDVAFTIGTPPPSMEAPKTTLFLPGLFYKEAGFDTVYYYSEDESLHPFVDPQTFFTWADSFNEVVELDSDAFEGVLVGDDMLPKAGVVLVKTVNNPDVYALVDNPDEPLQPILWHIEDEAEASAVFGADWADFVIDVSQETLNAFARNETLISLLEQFGSLHVDLSIMKKRINLRLSLDVFIDIVGRY